MPKIRNRIESENFSLLVRTVNPTTTGNIENKRRKSYLNNGPNVARPKKNFEESI